MSWFRLDDKFHSHEKVISAGNAAIGLFVRCATWSADQETEGKIPTNVAAMFGTRKEIATLVAERLWQQVEGGYVIPDYLEYNMSNEETAERRAKRSDAGRKGGVKSGESRRSKAEANASESGSKCEAKSNPDPTRPDPTPTEQVDKQLDDSTTALLRQSAVLFAEHRYNSNPAACTGTPDRYKAGIVTNVLKERTAEMLEYLQRHPNDSARFVARYVLGVPALETVSRWHADPHCSDCDGSGTKRLDDIGQGTYGPCGCRRAEPYLATVTELPTRKDQPA